MQNIAQDKLNTIAEGTGNLIKDINDGIQWVNNYLDDSDRIGTNYQLKKYRRTLRKVGAAVTQKPVIAFFGASQMGKSYMVKNILCNDEGKLNIRDHRDSSAKTDFLSQINPDGKGSEATSVVTRFTVTPISDPDFLPIKVKLFSPKDLAIILCDSYYSDFENRKKSPGKEEILLQIELIKKTNRSSSVQHIFTEDDVYEIKEYLEKFYGSIMNDLLAKLERDTGFWEILASNIEYISWNNWCSLIDILWNKNPMFTKLFNNLVSELNRINFPAIVYTDFASVLKNSNNSILDVVTLRNLLSQDSDSKQFTIQREDKTKTEILSGYLCGLSAEIIFTISDDTVEAKSFINNTDFLDFPGARSRLKLTEGDVIEPEIMSQMLLRGKVSYLFNTYSDNYEISTLCVCTSSTRQPDGRAVPGLVNRWISHNIGETPEERGKVLGNNEPTPLFIIFTFWNERLAYNRDTDVDEFEQRIIKTFNTRFEEDIKSDFTWSSEWLVKGNNEKQRFLNYYLLRDFIYSKETFKKDDAGKEIDINQNHVDFMQKLQELFKTSSLVKNFFKDPAKNWDESSTVGKDGSALIIENLIPAANNYARTLRYLNIIDKAKNAAINEVERHYHSDKSDEQVQKAVSKSAELVGNMNNVFDMNEVYRSKFGNFVEQLCITEQEIYGYFHEILRQDILDPSEENKRSYVLYRFKSPRLSPDKSYKENLEILREDYFKNSAEETEAYFKEIGINLQELFADSNLGLENKSDTLAEKAKQFWFDNKLNIENFEEYVNQGFLPKQLEALFESLRIRFDQLKISKKTASLIRDYVDRYNRIDAAEEMIAHITAGVINDFVSSVGWSMYPVADKEKISTTARAYPLLKISIPENQEVFVPLNKNEVSELYGVVRQLNDESHSGNQLEYDQAIKVPMLKQYNSWTNLLKISFVANCDLPIHNPIANNEIGQILNKLRLRTFSINN